MKKVVNNPSRRGIRLNGFWICLFMAVGAIAIYGALQLLKNFDLQPINHYLEYIVFGVSLGSAFLALMFFLRKKITHGYSRRMVTILCIVAVTTVVTTVFQRLPYLPYLHAYVENAGHKLAVMCHMTVDLDVSKRLNEASAQYMADAEAAAAAAIAAGETFEEVPNTVTGTDLLTTYSAYPVKYKFFYDTSADVDGLVYTLFGATSVDLKVEWPEDNVCRLYAIGAEAEGESFTTVK